MSKTQEVEVTEDGITITTVVHGYSKTYEKSGKIYRSYACGHSYGRFEYYTYSIWSDGECRVKSAKSALSAVRRLIKRDTI